MIKESWLKIKCPCYAYSFLTTSYDYYHHPVRLTALSLLPSPLLLSATDKVLLIKLRVQNGLNWDFCNISDSDLNSALTCICLWPGASEPLGPSEEGGPRDQDLEWALETLRGPALGSRKYGLLKKKVSTKLESVLFSLSPEDPIWSHPWVEVKWGINYPGGRKLCNNKRPRERRQNVPRSFLHETALSSPFHLF